MRFDGASYVELDGDAELFDGVSVLFTPGHSVGHQSVLVETDDGLVVLGGDVTYSMRELIDGATPSGWIPADTVSLTADAQPDRGQHLSSNDRRLPPRQAQMHAKVAVGAPGRETPVGHYYVAARFVPYEDPFLGVFAVETSAYSKLTEWPGGGVVGIHGTSMPQLLGQAVSHGCVRVSNTTARPLERSRRSARRSGLRVERGERAEGEVAFRREERAALAAAPREARRRAADRVAARELVPAAARDVAIETRWNR